MLQTVAYLLLAMAVIGALAYALYQVNARQNRLMAELTRLERLTAEVTMSVEALLDEVDQRAQRLSQLAAELERSAAAPASAQPSTQGPTRDAGQAPAPRAAYAGAEPQATAQAVPQPGSPAGAPTGQRPKRQRRDRGGVHTPAAQPQPEPDSGAAAPAASDRYSDLRQAVWRLADEGRDAVEIAAALGVPRGEVLLMLNLRGKTGPR